MLVNKHLGVKFVVAAALMLLVGTAAQAQRLEIVFKDTLWGAGIGAVIGTAQVALDDQPEKETHRIVQGAAIGAIVGLIYGVLDASGVFGSSYATYDLERDEWKLGPPPVWVSYQGQERFLNTRLLEVKF